MKILNLTQHPATPEQKAAGVVDIINPEIQEALLELLTFEVIPTRKEMEDRAHDIAEMAAMYDMSQSDFGGEYPTHAMIGGAPFFMSILESELSDRYVMPVYAFSRRESSEAYGACGSVIKTNVFRHLGFVEPTERY